MERFGVTETHLRMALADLARAVLVADNQLVYGGHLEEDGYTAFLTKEVQRLGRRDRPFIGYIPLSVHRQMTIAGIESSVADLSLLGKYLFLDGDGDVIDPTYARSDAPEPVDEETEKRALTAARKEIARNVDAQVVMGGKRAGFRGRMPGVIEEVILCLRAEKPVFIAGGFGGAAGDMAAVLGLDPEGWLGLANSPNPYLSELADTVAQTGWNMTSNGLTADENYRLAITYRASEIAYLVVTGLSRLGRAS